MKSEDIGRTFKQIFEIAASMLFLWDLVLIIPTSRKYSVLIIVIALIREYDVCGYRIPHVCLRIWKLRILRTHLFLKGSQMTTPHNFMLDFLFPLILYIIESEGPYEDRWVPRYFQLLLVVHWVYILLLAVLSRNRFLYVLYLNLVLLVNSCCSVVIVKFIDIEIDMLTLFISKNCCLVNVWE